MRIIAFACVAVALLVTDALAVPADKLAITLDRAMLRVFSSQASLVWLHIGRIHARKGRFGDALNAFAAGRSLAVEPLVFHMETARVLLKMENRDAARQEYEEILAKYPDADSDFLNRIRQEMQQIRTKRP